MHCVRMQLPSLVQQVNPDLIFYQAGVDPLHCDRLGQLQLTHAGLQQRNALVYKTVLDAGKRTILTLGGGYPKVTVIAFRHNRHCMIAY
jgi:acetoin utilization deacetylase AcuC-like enzyme